MQGATAVYTCMATLGDLLVLLLQVNAAFEVCLRAVGSDICNGNATASAAGHDVKRFARPNTTINRSIEVLNFHFVENHVVGWVSQEVVTEDHRLSSIQSVNELSARKQTTHSGIFIRIWYRLAELLHKDIRLLSWGWGHLVPLPFTC